GPRRRARVARRGSARRRRRPPLPRADRRRRRADLRPARPGRPRRRRGRRVRERVRRRARTGGHRRRARRGGPRDDPAARRPPAADAADEAALLAGHASAYVATAGVDDPADRHFGGVLSESTLSPAGAMAPLPVFQSSTLGYGPTRATLPTEGRFDGSEFNRQ